MPPACHTSIPTRTARRAAATVAAACLLGALATAAGSPASAALPEGTVTVQAEQLDRPGGSGAAFADTSAAQGTALLLWSNAAATGTVTTPVDSDRLALTVRGDQCDGAPTVVVRVDDVPVLSTTVPDTTWRTLTVPGRWAAGSHRVSVAFPNDAMTGWCDRNLRVDEVGLLPSPTQPSTVEAEQLALPPGSGTSFADTTASAGAGLLVWSDAAVTATLGTSTPVDRVSIAVRGDQCVGAPAMTVRVDGATVATTTVASSDWNLVTVPGRWAAGNHQVSVAFTNDTTTGWCDRNLRIDQIRLLAPVATPTPSSTPTPALVPAAVPAPSATPVSAPAPTQTPTATPSPAPSATSTPSPSVTATPTPVPSVTSSPDPARSIAPTPTPTPTSTPTSTPASGNPLAGRALWVDPQSNARQEIARRSGDANAVAQLTKIADQPGARWLGDWVPTSAVASSVRDLTGPAAAAGQLPVIVLYAIPHRDCGSYSAGGLGDAAAYDGWVRQVVAGLGQRRAVVVLEPDALAMASCLSPAGQADRTAMLRRAMTVLATAPGAVTYLDAGHSGWIGVDDMARRLSDAGVALGRGFSLNVSNFSRTGDETAYGDALAARLGGAHYVVDTSRNGNGPASGDQAWCNPAGRALGTAPTTDTGRPAADAYLWVKAVGESDGECGRGEPRAGTWWADYAIGLASRASW